MAAQAAVLEAEARAELAAQENENQTAGAEKTVEDAGAGLKSENAQCAICGGRHSTVSHVAGVKKDLQNTFFSAHNPEKTGLVVNISV